MDGGTQSRAALSEDAIADYAAAYGAKATMPPVVVFRDRDGQSWLADGFHRCYGAQRAGLDAIAADVREGTQRDAILYAVGANAQHGLRRTNADKRRAVEILLRDAEWSAKSDRWIATATGVHHETVAATRAELAISPTERRKGRDGKGYKATKGADHGEATGTAEDGRSDRGVENIGGEDSDRRDERRGDGVDRDERIQRPTGIRDPDVVPGDSTPAGTREEDRSVDDEAAPPIDMRGLSAHHSWIRSLFELTDCLAMVGHGLRGARGQLSSLAAMPYHPRHLAALKAAIAEALRVLDQGMPTSACDLCKDPDGSAGRHADCGRCLGFGYVVASQEHGAVVAAKPAAPKTTKRVRNRIVLANEDGSETPFIESEPGP